MAHGSAPARRRHRLGLDLARRHRLASGLSVVAVVSLIATASAFALTSGPVHRTPGPTSVASTQPVERQRPRPPRARRPRRPRPSRHRRPRRRPPERHYHRPPRHRVRWCRAADGSTITEYHDLRGGPSRPTGQQIRRRPDHHRRGLRLRRHLGHPHRLAVVRFMLDGGRRSLDGSPRLQRIEHGQARGGWDDAGRRLRLPVDYLRKMLRIPVSTTHTAESSAVAGGTRIRRRPPTTLFKRYRARRIRLLPTARRSTVDRDTGVSVIRSHQLQPRPGSRARLGHLFPRRHRGPTAGCVSLPLGELDSVLDWLQPAQNPIIVMGTTSAITSY